MLDSHLEAHEESLDTLTLRGRLSLAATVVAIVLGLSVVKALIHGLGLEFLSLNALFSSAIGGAIFIIGFLLSSVMADYKEAERLPAELRVALEGMHDDMTAFAGRHKEVDLPAVRKLLVNIVRTLIKGLSSSQGHGDLRPVLEQVDRLGPVFADLEQRGMQPNFVTRLRSSQDTLRRGLFRIYHIQSTQFVPSVHILVYTIVASVIFLLLFLRTEGSPESALIFGFVSYMFVYVLHLISMLERPFRKGHDTLDDVSLFLLREFDLKVSAELAAMPSRPVLVAAEV